MKEKHNKDNTQRYAFWECSTCKHENSGKHEECQNCFTNQPYGTEFYEVSKVTGKLGEICEDIEEQPHWQCTICNRMNDYKDTECVECHTSRKEYNTAVFNESDENKQEKTYSKLYDDLGVPDLETDKSDIKVKSIVPLKHIILGLCIGLLLLFIGLFFSTFNEISSTKEYVVYTTKYTDVKKTKEYYNPISKEGYTLLHSRIKIDSYSDSLVGYDTEINYYKEKVYTGNRTVNKQRKVFVRKDCKTVKFTDYKQVVISKAKTVKDCKKVNNGNGRISTKCTTKTIPAKTESKPFTNTRKECNDIYRTEKYKDTVSTYKTVSIPYEVEVPRYKSVPVYKRVWKYSFIDREKEQGVITTSNLNEVKSLKSKENKDFKVTFSIRTKVVKENLFGFTITNYQ